MNFPKFPRITFLLLSTVLIISTFSKVSMAQNGPFAPPAGQSGSTAVDAGSSLISSWATGCQISRGYTDISNPTTLASYGSDINGTGVADNVVVSLGDGGIATLTFATPISNKPGYDFAVFENAFSDDYLELAFVEVSSDGINFYRFDSVSLTLTTTQVGPFGSLNTTNINNLAGKYRQDYGTPFDLEELQGEPLLDINNVTHVRIVDVVGCIQNNYATYDSQNNIVNDPWPTDFASSGFDLDAVAVLGGSTNINEQDVDLSSSINLYPNPVQDKLNIKTKNEKTSHITVTNTYGSVCYSISNLNNDNINIDLSKLVSGLYIINVTTKDGSILRKKILKK